MVRRPLAVAALLFISGFCALVYQIAWLRELRLVFGASTPAAAAVLAVFMGGLGLGSYLLIRRVERSERPLHLYAALELGITLWAALTPALLLLARWLYIAVGGTASLGLVGGTCARLILTAVVLLPATFFMGGTLPAAARAVTPEGDLSRRRAALLYGLNTLGAVAGALLATFALLPTLGIRQSLWLACGVNSTVVLAAWLLGRARSGAKAPAKKGARSKPRRSKAGRGSSEAEPTVAPSRLIIAGAAVVGFVFMLMELTWYRMLSPLIGGSSYAMGLILAVALCGIGLGGVAYTARRTERPATLYALAWTCALEAACVALPLLLGDDLAVLALSLQGLWSLGLGGAIAGWAVVAAVVVLPTALVAGYQFPLLIALLGSGQVRVGRDVGLAYAANMAGGIAGALAGGFLLVPLITAPGVWRLAVVLLLAAGIVALWAHRRAGALGVARLVPLGAALLLLLGATMAAAGPTAFWRHSPIGVGRARGELRSSSVNAHRQWVNARRDSVAMARDGRESAVAIHLYNDTSFSLNGKIDGSAVGDAGTQIMGGLLGALLHPEPRSAMVVGLGTGSTAGWLAAVDTIKRVDVVEIEPALVQAAAWFRDVNRDVTNNPKVNIVINDARDFLLGSGEQYDVIFSEPSNPYSAGIASLFTHEFYQAVSERLRPGGVFIQWLQGYEIDTRSVMTVYATLCQTFGAVESWSSQPGDLVLISRVKHQPTDLQRLRRRVAQEPYRSALMHAWRAASAEGVMARYLAGPGLAKAIAARAGEEAVNRDDLNQLEFLIARAREKPSDFTVAGLRRVARARGFAAPEVTGGALDPGLMSSAHLASGFTGQDKPEVPATQSLGPGSYYQHLFLEAWIQGQTGKAVKAWKAHGREPANAVELMVAADAHAKLARPEAQALIARLERVQPTEAAFIRARWRLSQRDIPGAMKAYTEAVKRHRKDPWPVPLLVARALPVATALARNDAGRANKLMDLLSEPLAARGHDLLRRRLLVNIAMLMSPPSRCAEAMASFEPHVPWTESFLRARVRCYDHTGGALLGRAREDLARYEAAMGTSLSRELD